MSIRSDAIASRAPTILSNDGKNALDRVYTTDYEDPVTLTEVARTDAWYIKPNVTRSKEIRHVYHKDTLRRLLGRDGRGASPITRTAFTRNDIRKAPEAGKVHPELLGKRLQQVLRDEDTKDNVAPRLHQGLRADILLREPGQTMTITKIKPSGSTRRWTVNLQLRLDVTGKPQMDRMLDSIASVLDNTTTAVHVDGTRLTDVSARK